MNFEDVVNGFIMFSMFFEFISVYGIVGMSLGYLIINVLFLVEFLDVGKLVIICLMICG